MQLTCCRQDCDFLQRSKGGASSGIISSPAAHFHLRAETKFVAEKLYAFGVLDDRQTPKLLNQSVTDRRKNRLDLTFPLLTSKFVSSNPIFHFEIVIDCNMPILAVKVQKYPVAKE
jgi:hypothetical protein